MDLMISGICATGHDTVTKTMSDDTIDLTSDLPQETESRESPNTIKLKKQDIKYLDDLRLADPQAAIDCVFDRKEKWKQSAQYYYDKLKESQRFALAWKNKFLKETQMKTRWKHACFATWGGILTILVLFIVVSQMVAYFVPKNEMPRTIPTSGHTQRTPSQVLASVNILNGKTQGSGTIISRGEKFGALLTAGHNFAGVIGGNFWVYYPDGSYTKGTLLAIDRERDLALAKVDANTILGTSYVPRDLSQGLLSGVGYSNGQGPMFRNLAYNTGYRNQNGRSMWNFTVNNGPFSAGDSGGGVFIDDGLIAVTTQRSAANCSNQLYACTHSEIVQFLDNNKTVLQDCGDWSARPIVQASFEEQPPLWKPNSNIPLNFESNVHRLVGELQTDVQQIKTKLNANETKRPSDVPAEKKPEEKPSDLKRPSDIPPK